MPGFTAVLEGIQADQDFCRVLFNLQNYYGKKNCCHYCPVIQWTSRGGQDNPNDLYTNFAADADRGTPGLIQEISNDFLRFFYFTFDKKKPWFVPF